MRMVITSLIAFLGVVTAQAAPHVANVSPFSPDQVIGKVRLDSHLWTSRPGKNKPPRFEIWTGHYWNEGQPVGPTNVVLKALMNSDYLDHLKMEASAQNRFGDPETTENHGIRAVLSEHLTDEQPHLLLRYHPGETLRNRLNTVKQIPILEALQIADKVSDALIFAHEKGVSHRDLKPSQILLLSDRPGEIRLLDFGQGQFLGLDRHGDREVENSFEVDPKALGHPDYTAPEVLNGSAGTFEPRSDIYSLGKILFEMVVGNVHGNLITKDLAEAAIYDDFADIIKKATAHDPAQRYASASDFQKDVRSLMSRIVSRVTSSKVKVKRKRTNQTIAGVAALLATPATLLAFAITGEHTYFNSKLNHALKRVHEASSGKEAGEVASEFLKSSLFLREATRLRLLDALPNEEAKRDVLLENLAQFHPTDVINRLKEMKNMVFVNAVVEKICKEQLDSYSDHLRDLYRLAVDPKLKEFLLKEMLPHLDFWELFGVGGGVYVDYQTICIIKDSFILEMGATQDQVILAIAQGGRFVDEYSALDLFLSVESEEIRQRILVETNFVTPLNAIKGTFSRRVVENSSRQERILKTIASALKNHLSPPEKDAFITLLKYSDVHPPEWFLNELKPNP